MNIFECPKCELKVEAIALEVQHRCKHANNKQVQLKPRLKDAVALSTVTAVEQDQVALTKEER